MSSTSELSSFAARLRESILASECGVRDAECGIQSEPSRAGCGGIEFDELALQLFALQFEHNAPYRRWCEARGARPDTVAHWSGIPAAPTSAFKELDLSCLPVSERTTVFHSSGTTGQKPSRHYHNAGSLALYEASVLRWFDAHSRLAIGNCQRGETEPAWGGFKNSRNCSRRRQSAHFSAATEVSADSRRRLRLESALEPARTSKLAILTPPPAQAPHSSLAHMFETIRRAAGWDGSAFVGEVARDGAWALDAEAALERLRAASGSRQPLLMLGTAFSFVHLLDYLADQDLRFELPPGSCALETGGYKGRSRSLPKAALHALISQRLGIPPGQIVCEYGMSELSSQAYDSAIAPARLTPHAPRPSPLAPRLFHFPPWARVQIVSPETGAEVAEGETGLIRVFDLANVYSVMAIQTEDLGIRRSQGFALAGRAVLAEPRGCSLLAV
ncbi:MAG: hypothetical protein ABSD29_25145 [Verrucomicrobiota bacterium]|jgi:hypothetical protein